MHLTWQRVLPNMMHRDAPYQNKLPRRLRAGERALKGREVAQVAGAAAIVIAGFATRLDGGSRAAQTPLEDTVIRQGPKVVS